MPGLAARQRQLPEFRHGLLHRPGIGGSYCWRDATTESRNATLPAAWVLQ